MSFVDVLIGAGTGYVMSGGNPAGAAMGAAGAMQAGKDKKKTDAQFQQSTEISEKAYANLDPYRQAGTTALSKYMELLGLENPSAGAGAGRPYVQPETDEKTGFRAGVDLSLYGNTLGYGKEYAAEAVGDWTAHDEYQLGSAANPENGLSAESLAALRAKKLAAQNEARYGGAASTQNQAPGVPAMAGQPDALAKPQSIYDKLRATPGYNFQVQEEERAINRTAAGRGQFLSGNVLEELSSRAGERAIGTAYNGQLSALSGLIGGGQNAAVGQGSIASGISEQRYNVAGQADKSRDAITGSSVSLLDQAMQAYNKRNTTTATPNNGYTSVIPMPVMT